MEEFPGDVLLGYDQNIVKHTLKLNERRAEPIRWKYFQWLSLLFTEVYLDRFFRDPNKLLTDLNAFVESSTPTSSNEDKIPPYEDGRPAEDRLLECHRQRQDAADARQHPPVPALPGIAWPRAGTEPDHFADAERGTVPAAPCRVPGSRVWTPTCSRRTASRCFAGKSIEIIDIHKLREDMGEKTVAIDAFEGNNLVLVDEGHRGSSGKEMGRWMDARQRLCEQGFSFEYSATFGQAMKASSNKALEQEYAKCILFDYSYKYFYRDGFGKDYRILNLADDTDEDKRRLYLTACLLAFYQQQRLYRDKAAEFRPFLLESPLWVFVGGSVNAVRSENKKQSLRRGGHPAVPGRVREGRTPHDQAARPAP